MALAAGLGVGLPLLSIIGVLSFFLFRATRERRGPIVHEKAAASSTGFAVPVRPSLFSSDESGLISSRSGELQHMRSELPIASNGRVELEDPGRSAHQILDVPKAWR